MKFAGLLFLFFVSACCRAQQGFQRNFGGDKFDRALFIDHTSDGGYIICGYSNSFGNSNDIYVLKIDKAESIQWQKTIGGSRTDIGWGIKELKDKSYLLFGGIGVDSTNDDIFISKLDANGNKLWERSYGGPTYERCTQMIQTSDNNFAFIGQRNIREGNIDSYVFKIDMNGNLIWEKTFGGSVVERTFYGTEITGGDLLISGLTLPYGNNKADVYFLRITKNGELIWNKTYGEKNVHEIVHSFCANSDKRIYTLTGYSETTKEGFHEGLFLQIDENGNVTRKHTHNNNSYDIYVVKVDDAATIQWQKTFGGNRTDVGWGIKELSDRN